MTRDRRWSWGAVLVLGAGGGGGGGGFEPPTSPSAAPVTVTLTVDASADRHPISPDIYGVTLWYEYSWVADTTARDMYRTYDGTGSAFGTTLPSSSATLYALGGR